MRVPAKSTLRSLIQAANAVRVAATGTMAINGDVGDVGGVAQKTVAVRNAGA